MSTRKPTPAQAARIRYYNDGTGKGYHSPRSLKTTEVCVREGWLIRLTVMPYFRTTAKGAEAIGEPWAHKPITHMRIDPTADVVCGVKDAKSLTVIRVDVDCAECLAAGAPTAPAEVAAAAPECAPAAMVYRVKAGHVAGCVDSRCADDCPTFATVAAARVAGGVWPVPQPAEDEVCSDCLRSLSNPTAHCTHCGGHVDGEGTCNDCGEEAPMAHGPSTEAEADSTETAEAHVAELVTEAQPDTLAGAVGVRSYAAVATPRVAPAVTSGGVVLTGDVLDSLAAEAEQGYDLAKLRPRTRPVPPVPSGEAYVKTQLSEPIAPGRLIIVGTVEIPLTVVEVLSGGRLGVRNRAGHHWRVTARYCTPVVAHCGPCAPFPLEPRHEYARTVLRAAMDDGRTDARAAVGLPREWRDLAPEGPLARVAAEGEWDAFDRRNAEGERAEMEAEGMAEAAAEEQSEVDAEVAATAERVDIGVSRLYPLPDLTRPAGKTLAMAMALDDQRQSPQPWGKAFAVANSLTPRERRLFADFLAGVKPAMFLEVVAEWRAGSGRAALAETLIDPGAVAPVEQTSADIDDELSELAPGELAPLIGQLSRLPGVGLQQVKALVEQLTDAQDNPVPQMYGRLSGEVPETRTEGS